MRGAGIWFTLSVAIATIGLLIAFVGMIRSKSREPR
jgi:hypothetical protein